MLPRQRPQVRVPIKPPPRDVQVPSNDDPEPAPLEVETLIAQARVEGQFVVMSGAGGLPCFGRAVGGVGPVDGVDVDQRKRDVLPGVGVVHCGSDRAKPIVSLSRSELDDCDTSFKIPSCVASFCDVLASKVLAQKSADAVELATESTSVVLVAGEVEVECISGFGAQSIF
ncbi:unnamed protein product [Discula destructiva]